MPLEHIADPRSGRSRPLRTRPHDSRRSRCQRGLESEWCLLLKSESMAEGVGEDSLLERVTAAGAVTDPTAITLGGRRRSRPRKPCQQKGQGSPMKPPPAAVVTAASLVGGLQTMTAIP